MVVPNMIKNNSDDENTILEVPTIDMSFRDERSEIAKKIVKASEEFGFFKVINHGVSDDVIEAMERHCRSFFEKPMAEKQLAGPAKPFGYGVKNIGFNGDIGNIEYILLNANALSIDHHSKTISPSKPEIFRCAIIGYIEAVKRLASEILELMGDGILLSDTKQFSSLINNSDSDSLIRLNHYPPTCKNQNQNQFSNLGLGEHSDPQILTILKSNDVNGLQISIQDNVWVPVTPDPTAFWVNVGDLLQAMTNGRFVSVRHKVVTNSDESRISIAYFAAPAMNATIKAPPEIVKEEKGCLYRPFTWAEYKMTTYSLRLGESRLNLFRASKELDNKNI